VVAIFNLLKTNGLSDGNARKFCEFASLASCESRNQHSPFCGRCGGQEAYIFTRIDADSSIVSSRGCPKSGGTLCCCRLLLFSNLRFTVSIKENDTTTIVLLSGCTVDGARLLSWRR
jgi:hypothetical protein